MMILLEQISDVTLLKAFQWLPVSHSVKIKILIMACEALCELSPSYLSELILPYVFPFVHSALVTCPILVFLEHTNMLLAQGLCTYYSPCLERSSL